LHYLLVLARERHFGRAAKALLISQPALSQAVQQIEKRFGVAIVLRHQSGVHGFSAKDENILRMGATGAS
jgi:DNA-binding transcriptional LysR family regulator